MPICVVHLAQMVNSGADIALDFHSKFKTLNNHAMICAIANRVAGEKNAIDKKQAAQKGE